MVNRCNIDINNSGNVLGNIPISGGVISGYMSIIFFTGIASALREIRLANKVVA